MFLRLLALRAGRFYPRKYYWYSFLLEKVGRWRNSRRLFCLHPHSVVNKATLLSTSKAAQYCDSKCNRMSKVPGRILHALHANFWGPNSGREVFWIFMWCCKYCKFQRRRSVYIYIYIYIYMCVCVYVCMYVTEWDRTGQGERGKAIIWHSFPTLYFDFRFKACTT